MPHRPAIQRPADPRRRRLLAGFAGVVVGVVGVGARAAAPHAAAWSLDALMHGLAAHKSGAARFRETRTLSMLDAPIESSGVLRFAAPDRLEMQVLEPQPQSVLVRGDQVTLRLDGATHRFALHAQPGLAALVDGLRATLSGDVAGLRRAYVARLRGERRRWSLELVPRLPAARARISEIDIGGSAAAVRSIAIYQADGDHSLMILHPLARP